MRLRAENPEDAMPGLFEQTDDAAAIERVFFTALGFLDAEHDTIANALLFRAPAGVSAPDRIVTVAATRNGHGFNTMSYPTYLDYAAAKSLSGLAAINIEPAALGLLTNEGSEAAKSSAVSGNFFAVLGATPELGRLFGPDEDSAAIRSGESSLRSTTA